MFFKLSTFLVALALAAPSLISAAPQPHSPETGVQLSKRFSPMHNLGNGIQARNAHSRRGHVIRRRSNAKHRRDCPAPIGGNGNGASSSPSVGAPTDNGDDNNTTPTTTDLPPPADTNTPESPAPAPAPVDTPAPASGGSSGGSSDPDQQAYLNVHNTARQAHGANALTWADDLAQYAASYASGCVFQHSGGPYGENLASGTGDSVDASGAVQMWVDEASQYNPSNPTYSHFTQVVWKDTKEVGCAKIVCAPGTIFDASYGTSEYYVCEYRPAGNVIGRFAQNVQA